MTVNNFETVPYPKFPIANVTPFTYRDGHTYLELVEAMRKHINDSVVPTLQGNVDAFILALDDMHTAFLDDLGDYRDQVIASQTQYTNLFNQYMGEFTTSVGNVNGVYDQVVTLREEVETISGLTGEDAAVAFLVSDSGSASRAAVEAAAVAEAESVVADSTLPAWASGPAATMLATIHSFRTGALRIGIASDSTANDANDWPAMWAKLYAAGNPGIRVDRSTWNSATEQPGPVITVQDAGPGTPATGGVEMTDDFNRNGYVVGSTSSGGQVWEGNPSRWTMNGSAAIPPVDGLAGIHFDTTSSAAATLTCEVDIARIVTGDLWSLRAFVGGTGGATSVWVGVTVSTTGSVAMTLYKTINGANTTLDSISSGLGIPNDGLPHRCTLSISLNIQNVEATLITPDGPSTVSGTITENDVAELSTKAGLLGNSDGHFSIDSITIETPYVPAQPAPGVSLVNGSVGGASLSYHSARLATMFPDPLDVMIISIGHNNGTQTAAAFRSQVTAFADAVQAAHPGCHIVISSQNPQYDPAPGVVDHAARQAAVRELARSEGWDYLPAFERFARLADGGRSLVAVDGIHPTTPSAPYDPEDGYGATLWAKTWQAIIDRA